ncbi:hypothetical protein BKA67DRAFT_119795 [Truncatella angustata]|uniref:RING-type domain-containing protein n=1 Tax=Truncatella angustata TaxID=152316 RepID=A0A9P8RLN7_9PEZI|nr:uncharacterized protein BKA67DRAFT_119795 [Truncatella angustata]KAH6645615.1 hypothetical protein BKA67DRAFT_119795 [Truncatella angustata]
MLTIIRTCVSIPQCKARSTQPRFIVPSPKMVVVLYRQYQGDLTDLETNKFPENDGITSSEGFKVPLSISLSIIGALLLICGLIHYVTVRGRVSENNGPRGETRILTALRREVAHSTFGNWQSGNIANKVTIDFTSPLCAICLEVIKTNDTIYHLRCDHLYHQQCMEEWVTTMHPSCPLCRQSIYATKAQRHRTDCVHHSRRRGWRCFDKGRGIYHTDVDGIVRANSAGKKIFKKKKEKKDIDISIPCTSYGLQDKRRRSKRV